MPRRCSNAISNAIGYAEHYSRSHGAVIRVYDEAGNVIETHQHDGNFREWSCLPRQRVALAVAAVMRRGLELR